jgi:hypothetical protein
LTSNAEAIMSRLWFSGLLLLLSLAWLGTCRDSVAQDAKPKGVWEKYTYPKYEQAGPGGLSGDMHALLITTPDDFSKVIAWYAKVTDKCLEEVDPGSVSTSSDGVSVQDISSPSSSIRTLVQHGKSFSFTLTVSRAKDEKLTRIAMSYLKR